MCTLAYPGAQDCHVEPPSVYLPELTGTPRRRVREKEGAVRYDELTRLVQVRARIPSAQDADRVTRTALRALGERVPDPLVTTLAERLPPDLARHVRPGLDSPSVIDPALADDFVALVAERASVDALRAASVARIVFRVVDVASGGSLAGRAKGTLPEDVRDLVARRGR